MLKVSVYLKSGGVAQFAAADLTYKTSTDQSSYGKLVGYEIKLGGTHTAAVFLDISSVSAIVVVSDELIPDN